MLNTLIFRNAKRQAKEYLIYFVTMVLSVSIIYAFNALIFLSEVQYAIQADTVIRLLFNVISVIIVVVLSWLTGYMMNFMLKNRSKELSIYMVLGIENKEIVRLFRKENVFIGGCALLGGFIVGTFVFQVLTAIVMNLIGQEYRISFGFSIQAILLTVLYFALIFALSIFRSGRTIKRLKLYDLLYYNRHNEESIITKKWIGVLVFCFSLISLAIAIYLLVETPLGELMDFPLSILFIAMFIYCFYLSLSKFIVAILEHGSWRFKGNRAILLRNVTSKINSMSSTAAFLSIAFTISLLLITFVLLFTSALNYRATLMPFDISIAFTDNTDHLPKYQEFINEHFDVADSHVYIIYQSNVFEYNMHLSATLFGYAGYAADSFVNLVPAMAYSDYIRLREMLGYSAVPMSDNEFIIHGIHFLYPAIRAHANENSTIYINGVNLTLAGIYTEHFNQYDGIPNGRRFILILPDFIVNDMEIGFLKYAIVTNSNVSHSQLVNLLTEFDTLRPVRSGYLFGDYRFSQQTNWLDARVAIQANNGVTFIQAMPILYFAFILCIAGVVVLVSNILSEVSKYKRQFALLRNIGYSREKLDNVLLFQLFIFFIIPAIPTLILNGVLSPILAESLDIRVFVPRLELWGSIVLAYVVYMVIYLIYFIAVYILQRKSVFANNKY